MHANQLHSKKHPLDSTRQVLRNAKMLLVETSSKECGDGEEGDHKPALRSNHQLYRYRETDVDGVVEGSEDPEELEKLREEEQDDDEGNSEDLDDQDGAPSSSTTTLESDPLSSSPMSSASSHPSSPFSSSPSLSPSPPTRGIMMVGGYGVLSLNRVYKDSSELSNSEKKKLIFGSDQIKP